MGLATRNILNIDPGLYHSLLFFEITFQQNSIALVLNFKCASSLFDLYFLRGNCFKFYVFELMPES